MKIAAAVTHNDNLEFLDDTIPKTVPYKEIKQKAAETRAKLTGAKATGEQREEPVQTNGKKQKTLSNGMGGLGVHDVVKEPGNGEPVTDSGDGDVDMTG